MLSLLLMLACPLDDISADALKLSHPRYQVRVAAAARIACSNNTPAIAALLRSADPEVVSAAGQILSRHVDWQIRTLEPVPMIDAWWYDTDRKVYCSDARRDRLWHYYVAAPETPPETPPETWSKYYNGTRLMLRDRLASGDDLRVLRWELALMHARDNVFITALAPPHPDQGWDPLAYLLGASRPRPGRPGNNRLLEPLRGQPKFSFPVSPSFPPP